MTYKLVIEINENFKEALKNFSKHNKISSREAIRRVLALIPIIEKIKAQKIILSDPVGNQYEIEDLCW